LSRATGTPAGIVKQFVVSQASGATAPEPAADATVSLKDGVGPAVPSTVKAATTWKVTNDGQLPHIFQIWRFKSGKTAADLASYFATGGGSGLVPAGVVAGSGVLSLAGERGSPRSSRRANTWMPAPFPGATRPRIT
jgi:hypothetical protein